jgi:hypothetical protein
VEIGEKLDRLTASCLPEQSGIQSWRDVPAKSVEKNTIRPLQKLWRVVRSTTFLFISLRTCIQFLGEKRARSGLGVWSRRRAFPRSPAPSQGRDAPPDAMHAGNASCPEPPCVHATDRRSVHRRPGARVPEVPSLRPQVHRGSARRLFSSHCPWPRRAPALPAAPSRPPAPLGQPRRTPISGRPRAKVDLPPPP